MNINWHNVRDISSESGTVNEPVTTQEAKDYIRLAGFVDVDESPSTDLSDFSFDDTLIGELITSVRQHIEETCCISIVAKTYSGVITNLCGMIEIPYGPISSITVLKDSEDNEIEPDDYTVIGEFGGFVNLKSPRYEDMKIEYEAGYGNTGCPSVPKAIKHDILRLVAYYYDNRNEVPGNGKLFSQLASKYSRW